MKYLDLALLQELDYEKKKLLSDLYYLLEDIFVILGKTFSFFHALFQKHSFKLRTHNLSYHQRPWNVEKIDQSK